MRMEEGHRGGIRRYFENFADSTIGIQRQLAVVDFPFRQGLVELVEKCLRLHGKALQSGYQPPLVIAHRDAGLGNFRMASDGQICLFDFEHARWDNPVSDFVHLWLRLGGREDLRSNADIVWGHMETRFAEQPWFSHVLKMCIAEKALGHVNHLLEHHDLREESSIGDAVDRYGEVLSDLEEHL